MNMRDFAYSSATVPGEIRQRQFEDLRLSLTNRCNLACLYCVSEEEAVTPQPEGAAGTLMPEEFATLVGRLHKHLGLKSIRLTGGEPTLYKPLPGLVRMLAALGIPRINLTSNGVLLPGLAAPLKEAGLQNVNISLDSLSSDVFMQISRRNRRTHELILDGIEKSIQAGLRVKLNTTVYRGVNEGEILPLFEYAMERGLEIRYLELMNMGWLYDETSPPVYSQDEILASIAKRYRFTPLPREDSATANYWRTPEGGRFGVIANHSAPFCSDCNRLRLDSLGRVYGCLSKNQGYSIREILEDDSPDMDLSAVLERAMKQKRDWKFTGSELSMRSIGG